MRLKIQDKSDLVMPLTVLDSFTVDVRRLTPKQQQELSAAVSTSQFRNGQMVSEFDDKKWLAAAPDVYVAGWRGLTPSIIRQLGIDLAEDPPSNGDGTVHYDRELARDLWQYAHAERFAGAIVRFSREMLAAVELEKKLSSTASGG